MPRSVVLGNDTFHVGFDLHYQLRDLFFPMVGQENHLAGEPSRTGIWFDGRFAWLDDPAWKRLVGYHDGSLVSEVTLTHTEWNLEVVFHDAVDLDRSMLVRACTVTNRSGRAGEVRVFFHYDFHIYGIAVGDTVMYDPELSALVAYKGRRYFLANVQARGETGIRNWATGISDVAGKEGTWRDAEDGQLEGNPIAQGSVDATLALDLGTVPEEAAVTGYHWLAAGHSHTDIKEHDRVVRERGAQSFIDRTRGWWLAWRRKESLESEDLGPSTKRLYERSLLTIRSHVDGGGAVIASTDWDILGYSRDTYCYCWPRDSAIAAVALTEAGYGEMARRFFDFCERVHRPFDGYFLHKFTAAGEVASSWHPWMGSDGHRQLAIQEDSTGLVLFALWEHYKRDRAIEFIKPIYRPLIRSAADFLVRYRDDDTGLPDPSYDLWEERRGVHAFSLASVWAGLTAAANFSDTFGQDEIAAEYRATADTIREGISKYLWDPDRGYFSRMLTKAGSGYTRDATLDSAVLSLGLYGAVDPRDPKMRQTADAVQHRLWCQSPVGGLARYEGDSYQQAADDTTKVAGNPWIITTLWLAQLRCLAADSPAELDEARHLLDWVTDRAPHSGLLPEQLHPYTGEPLSVAPLTWSHAEYVRAVRGYLAARKRLAA